MAECFVSLNKRLCNALRCPLAFCALASCLWVQVYHYTGVAKNQGISTMDPKFVVLTLDDSEHTDESAASEGLEVSTSTCKSNASDNTNEEDSPVTCQDAQYPLVAPLRTGQFFDGTIKRVDEKAQACSFRSRMGIVDGSSCGEQGR
jgi:hypothetical protein